MSAPGVVRSLSYNPTFIKVVRALRLRPLARRIYYRLARSGNDTLAVECAGIRAEFVARNAEELRGVEAGWLGEREALEWLLRSLRPGDVFYDIGGYVGLYSVLAAKAVGPTGRVLVWEPERHSREVLELNLQRNAVRNVEIFPMALGAFPTTAELYVGKVIGNISLLPSAVLGAPAERQTVQIEAGDALRRREALPIPRAVKIDVEGAGHAVIAGLRETLSHPDCRFLCCEVHPAFLPEGIGTDDVLGAITACGFTLSGVRMSRDPFQVLAWKGERDVVGGACTSSS